MTADGAGIEFAAANPRPTAAPNVGGDVQVVGMNLLNYFNTFTGCTGGVSGASLDCRGAENQAELDRQTAKTVAAMTTLDADVFGVNEIENDGYGPDSALAYLVDRLNAATAPARSPTSTSTPAPGRSTPWVTTPSRSARSTSRVR